MINPITRLDYPDPDVIRVGNIYYMVSTTMHFMPGCEILQSYNLVNWEHCAYVYDTLDGTRAQKLENGEQIYGKGMWAATLRYHKECFYIVFVANDTHKTYLYTATDIRGPWCKRQIEGFYHDCSLLFDDDDRVYLAYGHRDIYITELDASLCGPKEGGLHRLVVSDADNPMLGYEGSHFYKINGKYYLFLIHSLKHEWRRTEACFVAASLTGEFVGGDVFNDDMGYCGQGIAQGGIVDTPTGQFYAILFQDRGAVGRIPVLMPVHFEQGLPVFASQVPEQFIIEDSCPGYAYRPLVGSDDFKTEEQGDCFGFASFWQFNHEPELSLLQRDAKIGALSITNGALCTNLTEAKNTLTQRMCYPGCTGQVKLDASGLCIGDVAGLSAFMGCYGFVGVERCEDGYYVVMGHNPAEQPGFAANRGSVEKKAYDAIIRERILLERPKVWLQVKVDFTNGKDVATFAYGTSREGAKTAVGCAHSLHFKLDHFTGCRFGLFSYATKQTGGTAAFSDFCYERDELSPCSR